MSLHSVSSVHTLQKMTRAQRIVSVVPSQTELLFDLGLEDRVVGITKFCVHPQHWFRQKQRIGGTKNLHIATIHALQPDLIIANREENEQTQIEELSIRYPVALTEVKTLDDAVKMIMAIGQITGTVEAAEELCRHILTAFDTLPKRTLQRVAYLIWKEPLMTVGGDTFIHDLLQRAGFQNVFAHQSRYPIIDMHTLRSHKPDTILLSSEPYPFAEKHLIEFRQALPHSRVQLVNGELFSWYGSRLRHAPAYFRSLLNTM